MSVNIEELPGAFPGLPAAPSRSEPIVSVRGLVKTYGKFVAVNNIDFDIPEGSIFGLIGPNGAGKSTTFSVIASLLKPTSGRISVAGFDPTAQPRDVRRVLGYMPDQLGIYGSLTAEEYLRFFAAAYKLPRSEWPGLIDGLLELVGLGGKRKVDVDTMSRGMKQRMSLARALVHDPQLLLLDEPASGLDPRARIDLRELLLQLSEMGKTIVISSHILAELETVCSDVAILEGGEMLVSGTPGDIATRLGGRSVAVSFTNGETEEFPVQNEREQSELLRRLVLEDEREVLSFVPGGTGLEDLFMQITEGGVR